MFSNSKHMNIHLRPTSTHICNTFILDLIGNTDFPVTSFLASNVLHVCGLFPVA